MMDEDGRTKDRAGRRSKRFLTPTQKYEIWLQLVRGEVTMADAAATAGVDQTRSSGSGRLPRKARWRR